MKKLLLSIAAVAMLALTSCQSETDYKAKGAEMARQLNELCDKQDGEAALALEKQIEKEEAAVIAKGDCRFQGGRQGIQTTQYSFYISCKD